MRLFFESRVVVLLEICVIGIGWGCGNELVSAYQPHHIFYRADKHIVANLYVTCSWEGGMCELITISLSQLLCRENQSISCLHNQSGPWIWGKLRDTALIVIMNKEEDKGYAAIIVHQEKETETVHKHVVHCVYWKSRNPGIEPNCMQMNEMFLLCTNEVFFMKSTRRTPVRVESHTLFYRDL